jgi:hypothetical protein
MITSGDFYGGDMNEGFDKRITKLEKAMFGPRLDWGEWYDMLKEMNRTIGCSEQPDEEFTKWYELTEGTREDFIKKNTEWAKEVRLYDRNRK